MLELIGFSLGSLLMGFLGQSPAKLETMPLVSWQDAAIFALPTQPDPTVEKIVTQYLQNLSAQGLEQKQQGIWIQSEWAELANHRGAVPASAASLTKIATTLAALETWGLDRRFETRIYTTGVLQKGVLYGDLVIVGGNDPLFVWEEAIALGNALNQLGIRQVKGNLLLTGNFTLNFQRKPQVAGALLKVGLDRRLWSSPVKEQYQNLPPGTPQPQVAIAGSVQVSPTLPPQTKLLLRHQSLTLVELLKQMNIYSNNEMAETLAQSLGGAPVVSQIAAKVAKVPPREIHLINGSGLGVENRISPRAVAEMFIALEEKLANSSVKVPDLFPVAGRDKKGTLKSRHIPVGITIKTGTLSQVSALAGVIPTKERGLVWFTIINYGNLSTEKFRAEQDKVLQSLAQHWKINPVSIHAQPSDTPFLGDPSRN
jgi:D-alanyl-D-alanine carboxypeptidase/D-alanyl-D-alanine-endopeptidase (penicillin-binding protein 4)